MAKEATAQEAKLIKCQGVGLNNGFAEGPNKFTIMTNSNHDVTQLQIGFDGPSQPEVKLVTKKDNSVDVTYTVNVAGDYKIHVKYGEHYIHGSPYKCKILGDVKASVAKVKVSGATKEALSGKGNEIVIDGREVGISGGLSAHMEGPSKPDLVFKNQDDGQVICTYTPTAAGNYKLHLKFQHYHLPVHLQSFASKLPSDLQVLAGLSKEQTTLIDQPKINSESTTTTTTAKAADETNNINPATTDTALTAAAAATTDTTATTPPVTVKKKKVIRKVKKKE